MITFRLPGLFDKRVCWFLLATVGTFMLGVFSREGTAADPPTAAAILQDLRSFNELSSVLHIAAHPDDENTQLITYLARGRGSRMAYLSVTRGDGGQNLLGSEFGETLGVIRTQELLAARRLDGGRQFFTRAIDFGFSKDAYKTLATWDKKEVLGDVVRVIRMFQPDVIVTRFSVTPGGTHGHHTASGILGVEAFKVAADPKAYPEQLKELTPWAAKRVVLNGGGFGGKNGGGGGGLRLDVGGNDPVLGVSFAEIAGRSRAMHKSQGFGNFGGGGGKGGGARSESFTIVDGAAASKDFFEGINTTWSRIPGGAVIGDMTEKVIADFNAKDPSASVPALLEIRKKLATLPKGILVDDKRHQFDQILAACVGLDVKTLVAQAEVVAGENIVVNHYAKVRSNVPARWLATRYPKNGKEVSDALAMQPGQPAVRQSSQTIAAGTPLSQPYWLREDHPVGLYKVKDAELIGQPENPPVFPVEHVFEIGGQSLMIADEPVQIITGGKNGEVRRRLEVIPPVALHFPASVALFAPGSQKAVMVEVAASRNDSTGTLSLHVPNGWTVTPAEQRFHLEKVGAKAEFTFNVTAPAQTTIAFLDARAHVGALDYSSQRVEVNYSHLPPLLLQPAARLKAMTVPLAIRGKEVGYLPGAGDSVAECLMEMGYHVNMLTGADLTPERLRGLDAVVVGVRAFNTRTDLAPGLPALFSFVEGGGNVIVQYNRPGAARLAPYDIKLSQSRVTDKDATMTFLAPEHPAMNTPNKITSADFEGWVQERAIYFPNQWDKRFIPLLACNDPGDAPQKGGLLVAQHGKGYFVYTSYSWFRQLPDGVPGAYRIFANLVSLGKK
jgi:LmbE family N-acetylglucosaminyl deacetylase